MCKRALLQDYRRTRIERIGRAPGDYTKVAAVLQQYWCVACLRVHGKRTLVLENDADALYSPVNVWNTAYSCEVSRSYRLVRCVHVYPDVPHLPQADNLPRVRPLRCTGRQPVH